MKLKKLANLRPLRRRSVSRLLLQPKQVDSIQLDACMLLFLDSLTGSSKRPPQGPRKEPREAIAGKDVIEGVDAEDEIDSDEEKRLRGTDLGALLPFDFLVAKEFNVDRFNNVATFCG